MGDGGGGGGRRRDDRMSDVGPEISAGVAPPDGKVNISTFSHRATDSWLAGQTLIK